MSFLDDIPEIMNEAFKNDLRPGKLTRAAQDTTDRYGNPIGGLPVDHPIIGIVESYEAAASRIRVTRQGSEASREDEDVGIYFLLHGVPIDPETGDHVSLEGPRGQGVVYRIVGVMDIDPARAGATVHARPTK